MKTSNRFLALIVALMMVLSLAVFPAFAEDDTAALDADTNVAADDTAAEDEAATTALDATTVVATVNGHEVVWGDAVGIYNNLQYSYSQYGYDVEDASFIAQLQNLAIQYAVQYAVMDQKAAELGFDQMTEEELATLTTSVQADWDSTIDMYVAYMGGLTEESTEEDKQKAKDDILALLATDNYTFEAQLEASVKNVAYTKLDEYIIKDAAVTDEEVQAAYDGYVAADKASYESSYGNYEYKEYSGETSWYIPSDIRGITHILLTVDSELLEHYESLQAQWEEQLDADEKEAEADTADATDATAADADADAAAEPAAEPVTQEQIEEARLAIIASVQDKIDEIATKLDAGTSFADLVVEYGEDPGMTQEPNKTDGYGIHLDSQLFDPAFVAGAFNGLEQIGDISEPVVGMSGVHILCYNKDIPSGPVALTDELKAEVLDALLAEKQDTLFQTIMSEWMDASEITFASAE